MLALLVAGYASWTVYCHVLVAAGATADTLVAAAWVPLLTGLGLWRLVDRPADERPAPPRVRERARMPWSAKLALALVLVGVHVWSGCYAVFWTAALVGLVLAVLDGARESEPPERARDGGLGLVALMLAAAAVTLGAHRSDPDDSFYLNLALAVLDHPSEPLLARDLMYGEPDLPFLAPHYRVASYELLVGTLARLTGCAPDVAYYLILPALVAAAAVAVHHRACGELGARLPLVGAAAVVVVLVAWGGAHRTYGNFAFVRLFQGKAALVTLGVPAVVLFAHRYARRPDARRWLALALAQVAALGLSSTALVVVPLAAAAVLLGTWLIERRGVPSLAAGLLASTYVLLASLAVSPTGAALDTEPLVAASSGDVSVRVRSVEHALRVVLGGGLRASIALLALLGVSLLPWPAGARRRLAGWSLVLWLVLLSPWTAPALEERVFGLGWRVFWAIPFPLLLGLLVAGLAASGRRVGGIRAGGIAAAVVLGAFVLAPPAWTLSARNRTTLAWPDVARKRAPEHAVARAAITSTPPGGLILAPRRVAAWVPTYRAHPRLVGIRPHFMDIVAAGRGADEARARRDLLRYVELPAAGRRWSRAPLRVPDALPEVAAAIERRGVDTVVVAAGLPWGATLGAALARRGYRPEPHGAYTIWARRPSSP